MKKTEEKYLEIIDDLLNMSKKLESPRSSLPGIDEELFYQFKVESRSLIKRLYGVDDYHYIEYEHQSQSPTPVGLERCRGILNAVKNEILNGYFNDLKGLVSSDLYSDFLEMAEHLLEENYKDPAAVIIGSVLEEHLRQLCIKHDIELTIVSNGKTKQKKASQLNVDLTKAITLNKLDNKNVTAWLDLRNCAAHGQYDQYSQNQVKELLMNVQSFISRYPI
jgi:hypothetical protein